MAFDAVTLTALIPELEALVGTRVVRIQQPDALEIVLTMRGHNGNNRLLLSAHPERARIHLTTYSHRNPAEPPNFCMYLRRHLEGAQLRHITRPDSERIVHLHFSSRDELGDKRELVIIVETMGKHSNIIVVNKEQNTILAAIKPITAHMSRYRQILPGLPYKSPPPQERIPLAELTELQFYSELPLRSRQPAKALLLTVAGLSPLWAQELVFRAGLPENLDLRSADRNVLSFLWQEIVAFRQALAQQNFDPVVYLQPPGQVVAVAPYNLTCYSGLEAKHFSTMSAALDYYFACKEQEGQFTALKQSILTRISYHIERVEKKLVLHLEAIRTAKDADKLRLYGELLFAHAHQLPPGGLTEVELYDWNNPEKLVCVPLDPSLSPVQNAQHYFARYTKAKKTLAAAHSQKEHDEEELNYLQSIIVALDAAEDLDDLEEIKAELEKEGYIKKDTSFRQHPKKTPPDNQPLSFVVDGYTIFVGRNNRQNDRLTLRLAQDNDIWLHTQNIPGSHVIIRCLDGQLPPEPVLFAAAHLAAYYSRARNSSHVPVDYTRRRYVKKPAGARPGFVIYDHQRTIYVTPDLEMIKALKGQL
ncbi:MAG: fibronectin/fibrinogen-binding protein [Firmicutes bacterium]|nr:fibronectin/fibrinogen-binding protein [Bacillota bacterium]